MPLDRQVLISNILRYGVWTSMFIVGLGGLLYVLQQGGETINYTLYHADLFPFQNRNTFFSGIMSFQGQSIIQLGVFVLIFTPFLRLVLAIYSFVVEKDYLYALIGMTIILIIAGSLVLDKSF